jgi:hypothetical protein
MTRTRLELLQWFGLLAAPLAWGVHLVFGFGVVQADCGVGGSRWGLDMHLIEALLTAAALLVALSAEGAALAVYRELRRVHYDAPGPRGRQYFFAVASLVGNALFVVAIALSAVGVFSLATCRQS